MIHWIISFAFGEPLLTHRQPVTKLAPAMFSPKIGLAPPRWFQTKQEA
jgi:hypothetical protein